MTLTRLTAHSFRNLNHIDINLAAQFNLFYGQNAAGKTSLLELVHYLGLARSFRTHQTQHIIQHQADHFVLFAELSHNKQQNTIGIERHRTGMKKIHVDGSAVYSLSSLAKLLPIKLLGVDTCRFFYDGPKNRRQYLDWGVFHVKQSYGELWQQLQQGLKQRNSGLKQGLSYSQLASWDEQIAAVADSIDAMREEYIVQLRPVLNQLLTMLVKEREIELSYKRGWATGESLLEVLKAAFFRDQKLGFTQYGPQRADLQLLIDGVPANEYLSQGQQKLVTYALHLAQGQLLQQSCEKSPLYLIDDIASELDTDRLQWLFDLLIQMKAQVLITAIHPQDLKPITSSCEAAMFHVKHSTIQAVTDISLVLG